MRPEGICHICHRRAKLSFEHVPPRRAFNRLPVVAHTLNHPLAAAKKIPYGLPLRYRAGMGVETLCERCNGFTGDYYGFAFAEWVRQALDYADRYERAGGQEQHILLPFHIEPLAVLKQIVTMTLAVTQVSNAYPMLRRFVLMPFEPLMAQGMSIRVYLNPRRSGWQEPQNRMNGMSVAMNVRTGESTHTIADIAFPPLGYWVARTKRPGRQLAEFAGLLDVTNFGRFHYGQVATVWLRMPVKLPVGPVAFHEQHYPNGRG